MKLGLMFILVCLLSGCGWGSRIVATASGYDKICVEGIYYLQFTSGATTQVDLDGKPVRCYK